jgi:cytochrome P450
MSIHYDPNLWGPDDPHKFVPERHLIKRHPMAYFPFGADPRSCIGMRFALMELKMCLARLLRQYMVLPGENIEEGFKMHETGLIQPKAVYIKLEIR